MADRKENGKRERKRKCVAVEHEDILYPQVRVRVTVKVWVWVKGTVKVRVTIKRFLHAGRG